MQALRKDEVELLVRVFDFIPSENYEPVYLLVTRHRVPGNQRILVQYSA